MWQTFSPTPKSAWFQQGVHIRQTAPDIVTCMERDKQDRHETPSGVRYNGPEARRFDGSLLDTKPLHGFHHVPDNEYAALMVCAPFDDPKRAQPELDESGEYIDFMLSCLTPKERSVVDLIVFGQMSLSEAGKFLGEEYGRPRPYSKAMVAKYRDQALVKLREKMQ